MKEEINNFYDLNAWQLARELTVDVYKLTNNYPREEIYGFVSQLKRASSSIIANIAEGFERYHFKDKIKFYYQARGSCAEVQSFIILSYDFKFITKDDCQSIGEKARQVNMLINGLIRSIEKQNY